MKSSMPVLGKTRSTIRLMHRVVMHFSTGLLLILPSGQAQTVSRAYIGDDGKAHVVYENADKTIPAQKQQVGCGDILIAADEHTVGWSVLVMNCCTSYPIPTAVVVYRDGKETVIQSGQMIHAWHFVDRGERVAVLSGPVHGEAAAANLYDSRTGRTLASWNKKGIAPEWAKNWE